MSNTNQPKGPLSDIEYIEHTLQLQRFQQITQEALDRELLTGVHVAGIEVIQNMMRDAIVTRLRSYVFGTEQKTEPKTVGLNHKQPATWWDHFKQTYADRWWMRWWIKKHPAKERTIHLSTKVRHIQKDLFPYMKAKLPKDIGPRITIRTIEQEPFYDEL